MSDEFDQLPLPMMLVHAELPGVEPPNDPCWIELDDEDLQWFLRGLQEKPKLLKGVQVELSVEVADLGDLIRGSLVEMLCERSDEILGLKVRVFSTHEQLGTLLYGLRQ